MEALIKRFLQQTPLHTFGAIGFLGASISLELSSLAPALQFLTVSMIVSLFTASVFLKYGDREGFHSYLTATSVLFGLILNFYQGLAALFTASLVFTVLTPLNGRKRFYLSAFLAHLLDALSTYLLIPESSEANIVVRAFIQNLGVFHGLLLSKLLLIALPLTYSYLEMDREAQVVFVKAVFVLGLSMAFRNFLIYL